MLDSILGTVLEALAACDMRSAELTLGGQHDAAALDAVLPMGNTVQSTARATTIALSFTGGELKMSKAKALVKQFDVLAELMRKNPQGSPLVRALEKHLNLLKLPVRLDVSGLPTYKPANRVLAFGLRSVDTKFKSTVFVPFTGNGPTASITVAIQVSPKKGFKPRTAIPFAKQLATLWVKPVESIAALLVEALSATLTAQLSTEPDSQTLQETNMSSTTVKPADQEASAAENSAWSVVWNAEHVTGKDDDGVDMDGAEPGVLDYEDAYDNFLDNLNDLIARSFGDSKDELKLRATTGSKTKVDIISGNLAQDLIDTFFPNDEKVMKFRADGGSLTAEVQVSDNSPIETYTFSVAPADEATASDIAIGKWEFLPGILGGQKADFTSVGSSKPANYAELLKSLGAICANQEMATKASNWIERNRSHDKLRGLEGFSIAFRGNEHSPIIMVSNGHVAMALLFKKDSVDMVRSIGAKSQVVGRWRWENSFARISTVGIITYLLGTVAAKVRGEYQVQ